VKDSGAKEREEKVFEEQNAILTRDEDSTSALPHISKSETKFSPKVRSFATLSPAPYKHNDSTYRLEFRDKSAPWSKAEDSTPLAR
jgi:hypothetical protein